MKGKTWNRRKGRLKDEIEMEAVREERRRGLQKKKKGKKMMRNREEVDNARKE